MLSFGSESGKEMLQLFALEQPSHPQSQVIGLPCFLLIIIVLTIAHTMASTINPTTIVPILFIIQLIINYPLIILKRHQRMLPFQSYPLVSVLLKGI